MKKKCGAYLTRITHQSFLELLKPLLHWVVG